MKKIVLFVAAAGTLAFGATSCSKTCEAFTNQKCKDRVPTKEACQAQYKRWFYNQQEDKCRLVEYTGCSDKGFVSEADCNSCKCNK